MSKNNWLKYKVQKDKYIQLLNDPSYEEINIFDECIMCGDSDWEINVFGHKDTHGLEIIRGCYNCDHTEQVRRLLKA